MSYLDDLVKESNLTKTENGCGTYRSSHSAVLDFFALGSSVRNLTLESQLRLFALSLQEDENLTISAMFYARDVRQGQGQRQAFRDQLLYLSVARPNTVLKLIGLVPEYGRWDDLLCLLDAKDDIKTEVLAFLSEQIQEDDEVINPSLLAKWLPSENASSKQTKRYARMIIKYMGVTPRAYRKLLTRLRAKLNVVEQKMTKKEWASIEYSSVPSQAMMKYRNAFLRQDESRFKEFLNEVEQGKRTINASTLYPYQIVEKMLELPRVYHALNGVEKNESIQLLNAQWAALPNYLNDKNSNAIAVVDTSGSMMGMPLNVAVSLGLYFAEKNRGPFKDHFITFSDEPVLQKVRGQDLYQKALSMSRADWGHNTDLLAVFRLLLDTAQKYKTPVEEMPKKIFIISDMQFDSCVSYGNALALDQIKQRYKEAGYERPEIVFWNVNAQQVNLPALHDESGIQLVSGFSPSLFKHVIECSNLTPYQQMLKVLNSERYALLQSNPK